MARHKLSNHDLIKINFNYCTTLLVIPKSKHLYTCPCHILQIVLNILLFL